MSSSSSNPTATTTQSRAWLFTLNNHSSVEVPNVLHENYAAKYVVWQEEKGETTGTKHLQGYVVFNQPKRLSTLKTYFPTAHWEVRHGTHEQAKAYCMKEETRVSGPWELGEEPTGPGARTDLTSVKRRIDEGASETELWEEHFSSMVKYHKSFREYKRLKTPERDFKSVTIVIYGPSGTGKTHNIHTNFTDACWISNPQKGPVWFDNYSGQRTLVLDEFYGWICYDLLLRLTDRYPLEVPVKGGFTRFRSRFIVITSNKPHWEWYDYSKFSCGSAPIKRRIDYVIFKESRQQYVWQQRRNDETPLFVHSDSIDFSLIPEFTEISIL